ncbi:MAG TPA: hypothetical protein VF487_19085 [Chitinophagaceae bacterium]
MGKLFFTLIISLILSSCVVDRSFVFRFDNEEIIQLNNDQSGFYTVNLNLSKFIKQQQTMLDGKSVESFKSLHLDTTIYFDNSLSTFVNNSLDSIEKEMFEGGNTLLQFQPSENRGIISIKLKFRDINQLRFQRTHIFNFIENNITFILPLLFPTQEEQDIPQAINFDVLSPLKPADETKVVGINPVGAAFNLQISPGAIKNDLHDKLAFQKILESDKSLQVLKSISGNNENIFYSSTFILPKGIKSFKGTGAHFNSDKKMITFKNSITEILNNPRIFEFAIEY